MKLIHKTLPTLLWLAGLLIFIPLASYAQERITFQSFRDGNNEVYSMRADGSDPLRLTNNAAFDGEPSFSGDGSKIVFTSTRDGNGEIYVMNADGTGQKRLTYNLGNDTHPSFNADASKIVFASDRDGGVEIYIMNADGTGQLRLTQTTRPEFKPSFSPDGSKILYQKFDENDVEIYIMNADGTNSVNLTDNTADDRSPRFSPDGSKIAYQVYHNNANWEVFTMNADGSDQVNISNRPGTGDTDPTWSPDGAHIAFTSDGEIWVMTSGGAGEINLTNNAVNDLNPSWSPANVAPLLEDVSAVAVNEGDVATVTGTISDPNAGDSFTLLVSWGEGGAPEEYELPAGTTSFEVTHVYEDDAPINTPSDNYEVILNVNDHRYGIDVKTTTVTVNNVDPTLSNLAVNPGTVVIGSPVTLTGDFNDAGYHGSPFDEALSLEITWGDGQGGTTTSVPPGSILVSHTYATIGSYTITVKVTDNDQGETIQTIPVVVSPPAAPAAPADLRIDYIAANRIQLGWTDASNSEDGFAIERCSNRGCNNFVEIARVGANTTVYLDANLFTNTQYYYRMRAYNLGGSSGYTNVVSAKTLRR